MKSLFEQKISLNGNWQLFYEENCKLDGAEYTKISELKNSGIKTVKAKVPGNFEIDLENAGVIDDIFFGLNPLEAQKRENYHLWYATEFQFLKVGSYELVFEGVDTFADIYLNGVLLGKCENMFIPHTFSANNLVNGKNELVVHIKPTFLYSRENPVEAGTVIHQYYNAESLNIRKAAHMFGWDIMPRMISGGLWKSVYLKKKAEESIKEAYLRTVKITEDSAFLRFYYNVDIKGDFAREYSIKLSGKCKDSVFERNIKLYNSSGTVNFEINNPYLWWTKDLGAPDLYDISVSLYHFDNEIDKTEFKLGIRTFELERTSLADENGKFCFKINGQNLFVRGTNWVPLDAMHSRDTERLPKALKLLDESNCNMVRMWGGNVYESEDFFDFCDENGIAVWQDFAMGCAAYPQNEKLFSLLSEEIEVIVKQLRQHASIALWAGDNECDEATVFWTKGPVDPNRNIITRKLIPEILNRHDPERIYLPSSPYIDDIAFNSGDYENTPEKHLWGPRDYFKGEYYANSPASFASETGYHGCPAPCSMEKFISKDKLWPWQENDEWIAHATSMELDGSDPYAYRIALMANQIKVLFGEEPENLERFVHMSQASQAEADKYFIERFRSGKWQRTGIIWWNLIDGWPQFSDAVVDYYYNKKLAFNVIKRSQEPVCLMFKEPKGNKLTLVAANETLKNSEIEFEVIDYTDSKTIKNGKIILGANSSDEVCTIDIETEKTHYYLIKWMLNGKNYKNYYVCGTVPYNFDEYYKFMKDNGLWEADGI